MATVAKLGPHDHGRPMTFEEFQTGDYQAGYRYELIDGRLYVSPAPGLPHECIVEWVGTELRVYARKHPEVINFVSSRPRVFVPARRRPTIPEPDLTAYHNFPLDRPLRDRRWQDVSPILVVEVPSPEDPGKDFDRNVELYFEVPSIKENWVIDALEDPDHPTLQVYRRHGGKWRLGQHAFGSVYTTRLLPGFFLTVDPHA